MKVAFSSPDVVVIDNLLAARARSRVIAAGQREEYHFVNAARWDRVYEIADGRPLESEPYLYAIAEAGDEQCAPPREHYQPMLDAVVRSATRHAPWLSRMEDGMVVFRMTMFPARSALNWHDDKRKRLGTFVLYLHETWGERWGGELLVRAGRGGGSSSGLGLFVSALPNRLVLLRAGVQHMIKRIELAAGDAVRLAAAGSFVASMDDLRSYRRR